VPGKPPGQLVLIPLVREKLVDEQDSGGEGGVGGLKDGFGGAGGAEEAEFTSESWAASKSARKRGALILCLRGCEREIPLRDLFN